MFAHIVSFSVLLAGGLFLAADLYDAAMRAEAAQGGNESRKLELADDAAAAHRADPSQQ
jgi:hypothetical protein